MSLAQPASLRNSSCESIASRWVASRRNRHARTQRSGAVSAFVEGAGFSQRLREPLAAAFGDARGDFVDDLSRGQRRAARDNSAISTFHCASTPASSTWGLPSTLARNPREALDHAPAFAFERPTQAIHHAGNLRRAGALFSNAPGPARARPVRHRSTPALPARTSRETVRPRPDQVRPPRARVRATRAYSPNCDCADKRPARGRSTSTDWKPSSGASAFQRDVSPRRIFCCARWWPRSATRPGCSGDLPADADRVEQCSRRRDLLNSDGEPERPACLRARFSTALQESRRRSSAASGTDHRLR